MNSKQTSGEPRGRLRKDSASLLSDTELLAVLFQRGTQVKSAMELSEKLLQRFGGLRPLLQTEPQQLLELDGIGSARLAIIKVLPELAKRYFEASLPKGQAIRSPADTEAYLVAKLRDLPHELFCCLYLDNRHRIISFDELFRGTIDGTSVYPREVVKQALSVNAAAVIVAHNHPSGVAEPSQADERITRRLKAALELVDIRLLDHLVIGGGKASSLAKRGML